MRNITKLHTTIAATHHSGMVLAWTAIYLGATVSTVYISWLFFERNVAVDDGAKDVCVVQKTEWTINANKRVQWFKRIVRI